MDIKRRVFESWHRFGDGAIDHDDQFERMFPVMKSMRDALEAGKSCPHKKTAWFCKRLLERKFDGLWAFSWADGVEPTNNSAERVLRWEQCTEYPGTPHFPVGYG